MALRRIQTGNGGRSVNQVLGSLRAQGARGPYGPRPIDTSTEAKATLTTALTGSNNDLKFTAKQAGAAGNSIRVRYVSPGTNNAALGVVVSGDDITVNLATDGSAVITSTANQVKAAIQGSPAGDKVSVALATSNDGTGLVTALAYTALSGGTTPS